MCVKWTILFTKMSYSEYLMTGKKHKCIGSKEQVVCRVVKRANDVIGTKWE